MLNKEDTWIVIKAQVYSSFENYLMGIIIPNSQWVHVFFHFKVWFYYHLNLQIQFVSEIGTRYLTFEIHNFAWQ